MRSLGATWSASRPRHPLLLISGSANVVKAARKATRTGPAPSFWHCTPKMAKRMLSPCRSRQISRLTAPDLERPNSVMSNGFPVLVGDANGMDITERTPAPTHVPGSSQSGRPLPCLALANHRISVRTSRGTLNGYVFFQTDPLPVPPPAWRLTEAG